MCLPAIDSNLVMYMLPTFVLAFTLNSRYALIFALAFIVGYFGYVWAAYKLNDVIRILVEKNLHIELEDEEDEEEEVEGEDQIDADAQTNSSDNESTV